jgi:hypothetical protein
MPDWVGTVLFLVALGLTGAKVAEDFGEKGLLGYAMLLVTLTIYAAAVSIAFA